MTWLHAASTVVLLLVAAGLYFRRRPRTHLPFMVAALVLDLSLVLYIELTRAAVETLVHKPISPILGFHVTVSVLVLLLYAAQVTLGLKKLRGGGGSHLAHRYLGIAFVVVRLLNYGTSYVVASPTEPTYAKGVQYEAPGLAHIR